MVTAVQTPEEPAPVLPDGRKWLTPEDVAAAYDVSPITVRDWINVGVIYLKPDGSRDRVKLRAKKVGTKWRILPTAVAAFVAATNAGDEPAARPESEKERKRRQDARAKRLKERFGIEA